jgi:UPF0755 protein
MKTLLKIIAVMTLFAIGAVIAGYQYLSSWQAEPYAIAGEVIIELSPGLPLRQLAHQLESKNVVNSAELFTIWMKITREYPSLQAGNYQFKGNVSPYQVLEKMKKGDIYIPLVLQVTIPEGFTLKMLNNRLATKGVGKLKDLQRLVVDKKFLKILGINSTNLEGYTYPATYNFEKMPTGDEFYRKTVKTFFEKIPADYERDVAKLGLTLTQAITFASLIELETMRDEEKPIISEVIWSRLKKGDVLGIDAAIIYGIDNYDGDIRWKDLKNKNNPYNTRIHRGLPPTPIGAVSRSSLEAVLKPTNLGYYYYVLDSADQSRHAFSKSIGEHNALVKKLLKAGGVNRIKRPEVSE